MDGKSGRCCCRRRSLKPEEGEAVARQESEGTGLPQPLGLPDSPFRLNVVRTLTLPPCPGALAGIGSGEAGAPGRWRE